MDELEQNYVLTPVTDFPNERIDSFFTPEGVSIVVSHDEIVANVRRLKTSWSIEAQQDLRSFHNLEAEENLTQILSREITLEIDREIISDFRSNFRSDFRQDMARYKTPVEIREAKNDWKKNGF